MNTIISKRQTAFTYTKWFDEGYGTIVPEFSITINGGAGVLNPKTIVTPQGVATLVDDDTLEKLMTVPKFISDRERGLILVIEGKKVKDSDAVDEIATSKKMIDTADIQARPLTPEDLENDGAVVNDDGSVNITEGGKNALARRQQKTGKKSRGKH